MTATLLPNAKQTFLDGNGKPLAGGQVFFYIPNTSTLKSTWQDPAQTILNTNPVILDAAGEAIIWGSGTYRQVVYDVEGNLIWDQITEDANAGLTGDLTDDLFVAGTDFTPGTTTQLTLSVGPGSINNTWIFFDGVYQADNQIATLSNLTLTFTSPIPVGTTIVTVKIGTTVAVGVPPAGSVTDATVAAGAGINSSKLSYLPTFPGGARRTVQQKLSDFVTVEDFGAVNDGTTDNAVDLQTMLTVGGNGFWIPAGIYKFGAGLSADYSSNTFPNPGSASPRIDIIGESIANSILSFSGTGYAMTLKGSDNTGAGQGIVSLDRYSGFTLQDFSQAKTNNGMVLTNKAWWEISNIIIQQMQVGLNLTSCFSARVQSSFFNLNQYGIFLDTTSLGPCNEIAFASLVLQSNSLAGVLGSSMGSSLIFRDCSFESNGTQGNLGTGGFVGNISGVFGNAGPITFDNCYFENSAGVADISIDNTSPFALTVIIRGCLFQRISNTNFVRNNISVTSSGGGPVTVLLEGNSFFSTGSYAPDPSRPFFASGPGVQFIDNGGNIYSETTSLAALPRSGRAWAYGSFLGASAATVLLQNASVSRTGTGSYTVTFLRQPPLAPYVLNIMPDAAGQSAVGVSMVSQSQAGFSFQIKNQAGTLFDPTTVFFEALN
jgi:hypothetical protein